MSGKPALINIAEMIDLAIGTPEIGTVDFVMLHTVLHCLAQQLRCTFKDVEVRGPLAVFPVGRQPEDAPTVVVNEFVVEADGKPSGHTILNDVVLGAGPGVGEHTVLVAERLRRDQIVPLSAPRPKGTYSPPPPSAAYRRPPKPPEPEPQRATRTTGKTTKEGAEVSAEARGGGGGGAGGGTEKRAGRGTGGGVTADGQERPSSAGGGQGRPPKSPRKAAASGETDGQDDAGSGEQAEGDESGTSQESSSVRFAESGSPQRLPPLDRERISLVSLNTFNKLQSTVDDLKNRVYGTTPNNEELLEGVRSQSNLKGITEMWQSLNVSSRLEAAEAGIAKLSSLMQDAIGKDAVLKIGLPTDAAGAPSQAGMPTSGAPASGASKSGGPTSGGPTSGGPASGGTKSGGHASGGPASGGPASGAPSSGAPTSGASKSDAPGAIPSAAVHTNCATKQELAQFIPYIKTVKDELDHLSDTFYNAMKEMDRNIEPPVKQQVVLPTLQMPPTPAGAPGMPGGTPGMPGATPGMPGATPGMPGATPGMPGATPGMMPVGTSDAMAGVNADGTPMVTPGTMPTGTPGVAPMGTPGGAPMGTPGGKPGAAPGKKPGAVPGQTPAGAPGTAMATHMAALAAAPAPTLMQISDSNQQDAARTDIDPHVKIAALNEKVKDLGRKVNQLIQVVFTPDGNIQQQISNLQDQIELSKREEYAAAAATGTVSTTDGVRSPLRPSSLGAVKDIKDIKDMEDLMTLYKTVRDMQTQLQQVHETAVKLATEKDERQHNVNSLLEQIELLKTIKLDREDMAMALADKADLRLLSRKVSHDQFEMACDDLSKGLEQAVGKLNVQESLWQQALDDIQREIETKLDKVELGPVRDFFLKKMKQLQESLKQIADLRRDAEAAGTKSKLLRNVNCISCDANASMQMEPGPAVPPKPLQPMKSMRPYLTYELDAIRKSQANALPQRNMHDWEKIEKQMTSPRVQKVRSETDKHICNRYCGGSHTTTTPAQRVARLGHFVQQWGPEVLPLASGFATGDDGRIYKISCSETVAAGPGGAADAPCTPKPKKEKPPAKPIAPGCRCLEDVLPPRK